MNAELSPETQTNLVSYYIFNNGIAEGDNTGLIPVMDQKGNNGGTMNNFSLSGSSSNYRNQFSGFFTLPVSWLSFKGEQKENTVMLNWITANEHNSKEFLIQRSHNKTDWSVLGSVAAAGNSSNLSTYFFTDVKPVTGNNYYRLIQQDIDGKSGYSKIVNIDFKIENQSIRIINNPVLNNQLQLQANDPVTIKIWNSDGKFLLRKQLNSGIQSIDLSHLPKAVYFLQTEKKVLKFVLQ
jgi:hypothetical protein